MAKLFKGVAFCALMVVASNASFADNSRQDEVKPLKDLVSKTSSYCVNKTKALQCVVKDQSLTAALRHCKFSATDPKRDPHMAHLCEADDVLKELPFDKKSFDMLVAQYHKGILDGEKRTLTQIQDYVNGGKKFATYNDLEKAVQAEDAKSADRCNMLFRGIRDQIQPIIQIYKDFDGKDCEGF